jgi:hypothetical protein
MSGHESPSAGVPQRKGRAGTTNLANTHESEETCVRKREAERLHLARSATRLLSGAAYRAKAFFKLGSHGHEVFDVAVLP